MPHVTPLHAEDPSRLGRYRLTGRITGMAAAGPVYLATTVDGGDVMVTLLAGDWTADSAVRDRFTAEASAASRVAPFCAARILGAGFDRGQAFLVSEYVAGPALLEFVTQNGPWEGRDLVALAIGAATGLAAIHQAGLVHGDFGPQHVVLGVDGPRVVEFGITPPYGAATPAADMRAWARTVLFTAAGRVADPASPRDLALLPDVLRRLVIQCVSVDPAAQPSARSVVIELLGDPNPPAGVLGEGSRRAVQAAVRPAAEPASDAAVAHRGGRRRAVRMWWVVGVAICILAIAVAIRFAENQGGQPANLAASSPPPHTSAAARSGRPTPPPAVPAALAGKWSGQVSQTNPAAVFSVTVTLASGRSGGSVHYRGTSFSCSGKLVPAAKLSGGLQLQQRIARGPCEGGVVTLVPGQGNSVQFGFKGKQGPAATGTLTRS